jgi:hypothetical protein
MSAGQKKSMRRLTVVLVQGVIFLFLLVVMDGFLWLAAPVSLETPAVEMVLTQNLPGIKPEIVYQSGKYALRSLSAIAEVKPDHQIRILCLGASTTHQVVQETQDTWCGILETRLRAHYGPSAFRIQTMAHGPGGDRAVDTAYWLKETFDRIEPDIVITMLGINDLAWNGGEQYERHSLEEIFAKKDRRKYSWYRSYSQIYRRIFLLKKSLALKEQLRSGEVVEWHSSNLPDLRSRYRSCPSVDSLDRNPDPIDEFTDSVGWLMAYLQERDVPVLVLGQPVLWQDDPDADEFESWWFSVSTPQGPVRPSGAWLTREMARYNAVQESMADGSSDLYLDLDRLLPKTLDNYFDDCHYTDLGNREVADVVLPVLIPLVDDVMQRY